MFDPDGRVVQWYIDICARHGVDARGVPWYDDLYLDIVVSPAGGRWLLDADELEAAVGAGVITPSERALAHAEAHWLLDALGRDAWPLLQLSVRHLPQHLSALATANASEGRDR